MNLAEFRNERLAVHYRVISRYALRVVNLNRLLPSRRVGSERR